MKNTILNPMFFLFILCFSLSTPAQVRQQAIPSTQEVFDLLLEKYQSLERSDELAIELAELQLINTVGVYTTIGLFFAAIITEGNIKFENSKINLARAVNNPQTAQAALSQTTQNSIAINERANKAFRRIKRYRLTRGLLFFAAASVGAVTVYNRFSREPELAQKLEDAEFVDFLSNIHDIDERILYNLLNDDIHLRMQVYQTLMAID